MSGIEGIASSALAAIGKRQESTAQNIANFNAEGASPTRVTFEENPKGGVTASSTKVDDKVDITREAVDLVANAAAFTANIKVLKTANQMNKSLLDIMG